MRVLARVVTRWGTPHRPTMSGVLWIAVLLFSSPPALSRPTLDETEFLPSLDWLQRRHGGLLLVPPFAATKSILLYLADVSIAQPFAIVVGSTVGVAIGTLLSVLFGFGAGTAALAAPAALIVLPLLRAYHPPGVALALYPALLHPGRWFAVRVVLPFTIVAVVSASVLSRLLRGWPRYPHPL